MNNLSDLKNYFLHVTDNGKFKESENLCVVMYADVADVSFHLSQLEKYGKIIINKIQHIESTIYSIHKLNGGNINSLGELQSMSLNYDRTCALLDAAKRHYAMTYALLPIEIQNIVPSTI
jgi:hypothetical protein